MFISDRLLFLELHKTGSSHIRGLLAEHVPGRLVGRHNRPHDRWLDGRRAIVGSVRSPWSWYLSLWAYGVDGKGALRQRLTTRRPGGHGWRNHPVIGFRSYLRGLVSAKTPWRRVYAHDRPELFRAWLGRLLDPRHRHEVGEGYGSAPMSCCAGLMTFRFLVLFSDDHRRLARSGAPGTPDELRSFAGNHIRLDHVIRTESLVDDLLAVLDACGIPLSEGRRRAMAACRPSNASSRQHGLGQYYDSRTVELVRRRESLLIERYGYDAPSGAEL